MNYLLLSCLLLMPLCSNLSGPALYALGPAPTKQIPAEPAHLRAAKTYTSPETLPQMLVVETLFGPLEITEAVLIELLHHPVVQRMKEIDQHGPPTYFGGQPTFSRYDHCVGVMALLRLKGCSLTEQVAGLLHDASHTVYSHVADYLFKTGNQHSYQDMIHEWYLEKMGVEKILKRYGLTIAAINPDNGHFSALEQKSPKLCADRIQYILHTGLVFGKITPEEIRAATASLEFTEGMWVFTSIEHARMLADLSVHFTQHFWATAENLAWRYWLCSALQQATALDLITREDIHFGTDLEVLERLQKSSNPHIQQMLERCFNAPEHFTQHYQSSGYDLIDYPKVRAVDPLIKLSGEKTATPLTERDAAYKETVEKLKTKCACGIKVKLKGGL